MEQKKDENLFWASSSSKIPRALIGWLRVRGHHRAKEGLMIRDQEKARLGVRAKAVAIIPQLVKEAC